MGRSALGSRHLVLGVIAAIATSLMALGSAWAQTDPYPSPSPSPSPAPGDFEGALTITGNVAIGCGFEPGTTVTIFVDGGEAGTGVADGDGCLRVTMIVEAGFKVGHSSDESSAVETSPGFSASAVGTATVHVPAVVGEHEVCFRGTRMGGGTLTLCGPFWVFGVTTGAAGPASPPGSILPFTGANLALWVFLAAMLVLVGSLVVIASGRRRRVRA